MAPAVMDTMTVHLENNNVEFRATGSKIKFEGFMKVYVEGTDNEKKEEETYLPELNENDEIKAKEITPKQHFTQPPPRYTEATLVGAMEKKGSAGLRRMRRRSIRSNGADTSHWTTAVSCRRSSVKSSTKF